MTKPVRAFRIVIAVLYALVTAFLLISFLDTLLTPTDNLQFALGIYLAIIVLIIGGIAYAAITVFSLTLAIIFHVQAKKHEVPCVGGKLFIVFSVLPALTFALFFFTTYFMVN